MGPDWVAALINAVGNATCVDPVTNQSPWLDTVILVVWDDWGGFYDHVGGAGLPAQADGKMGYANCLFPLSGSWGCGYTYGFRVPFMVVSAYTSNGYVSGACTQNTQGQNNGTCCGQGGPNACSQNAAPYQHDFGSILAFIENNFKLGIGNINSTANGGGGYLFADAHAPEQWAQGSPYLPLGDFFDLWYGSFNYNPNAPGGPGPKSFGNGIQVAGPDNYNITYFKNGGNGQSEDPDNDAIDPQD